jgi:ketosteroid isomerase-like protein
VRRNVKTRVIGVVLGLSALAGVVGGVACGGNDSNDRESIEEAIRTFEKAWDDQDYDAFAAVHTDQGIRAQLADAESDLGTEEGRREAFSNFAEDDRAVVSKIGEVEVDGDAATASVETYFESREEPGPSAIVLGATVAFAKDGDDWKIDGVDFRSPEVPDGVQLIKAQANEFAFGLQDEPESGHVAFEIENVGEQPHHVVVEKIPEDLDIEAALQSEEEPEGLVYIGGTPPWDSGETTTIVFTEDLPAGRYVLLCFMPDTSSADGAPHAMKGMYTEFRVS